jgi:hypothetical protein
MKYSSIKRTAPLHSFTCQCEQQNIKQLFPHHLVPLLQHTAIMLYLFLCEAELFMYMVEQFICFAYNVGKNCFRHIEKIILNKKRSCLPLSMPKIELDDIDEEVALSNIIASIALEEAALSHILNAEGEKIQRVVGTFEKVAGVPFPLEVEPTIEDLIAINDSVGELTKDIGDIEYALHNKLHTANAALDIVAPL